MKVHGFKFCCCLLFPVGVYIDKGCNDTPISVLRYIAIWKTHIAIHLVSLFLSITAPSSVL